MTKFAEVTLSQTLKFWSKPRCPILKPCHWNTTSDRQDMSPVWRTIIYQRLPCMATGQRGEPRWNATKTASKSPSLHVMMTLYGGQTWWWSMMPGAIPSSKWLTSSNKSEEMHTKQEKQKESSSHIKHHHRTLLSLVDTAYNPAFPTLSSSVMPVDNVNRLPNSVPADNVNRLPNSVPTDNVTDFLIACLQTTWTDFLIACLQTT